MFVADILVELTPLLMAVKVKKARAYEEFYNREQKPGLHKLMIV